MKYGKFWCGAMAALGMVMGIQDMMGMEAYLAYAATHWVVLSPMVGFGIAIIAVICHGVFVVTDDAKR